MDASVAEQVSPQAPIASLTPIPPGAFTLYPGCRAKCVLTLCTQFRLRAAAPSSLSAVATQASPASSSMRDSPTSRDHIPPSAYAMRAGTPPTERPKSPAFSGLGKSPEGVVYATPDVRLHHRAVLVAAGDDATGVLGGLVRQLSIDQFENEGRRVSIGTPGAGGDMSARRTTPATSDRSSTVAGIHKTVLAVLLRPREWRPQADRCVTNALLYGCIPYDKFADAFSSTST